MHTSSLPALCRPDGHRPSTHPLRRPPWREGPPLGRGLGAEKERELAARIQAGDMDARNELVEGNLALAERIARHYSYAQCAAVDLDDLIQEVRIGLMRAADSYDPARGRFSTYAVWWMRQKAQRAMNESRFVRLPLYHFVRHTAARHEVHVRRLVFETVVSAPEPHELAAEAEPRERLHALLDTLSDEDRSLIGYYLEEPAHRPAKATRQFRQAKTYRVQKLIKRLQSQAHREGATLAQQQER